MNWQIHLLNIKLNNKQLLHDYLSRFVVHGGVNPAQ